MKNLSVKKQLSLAFGALAVLVLLVSLFALHGLSGANDRFSGYVNGAAKRQDLATDVRIFANRRAIGVRDMVLVKTVADRESAKTMAVKFRVCGPDIGGGKSVIRFDASTPAPTKHGVLERWYKHIGPYLKSCYGTGGDVGVDEVSEATAVTERVLGLRHVQEGIARGHAWGDGEHVDAGGTRERVAVIGRILAPDPAFGQLARDRQRRFA